MIKDRRLGRGLAALLGTPLEAEVVGPSERPIPPPDSGLDLSSAGTQATLASQAGQNIDAVGLLHLPLAEIEENPFQPRREFSEAEIISLSESLKEHDLLQPILVRRVNGRFQLISGERRLRAARHAGWTSIPARIREADDRLVAELAIVENLQRKDLNPVEKALSFKRYLDEHRCTQDDLARRLKIDRSTIANLMRLLELPAPILDGLQKGAITAGHARTLLPLGDEHEQIALAEQIQRDGLSVRDVERMVTQRLSQEEPTESPDVLPGPGKTARTTSDQVTSLEQELRHALGTKVQITATSRGRGKIVIHFQDHDEFDRLRSQLTDSCDATRRDAA